MFGLVRTPSLVEHPRVEAERAAGAGVVADEDALRAEAGLGQERVGAAENFGGRTVWWEPERLVRPQRGRPGFTRGRQVTRIAIRSV